MCVFAEEAQVDVSNEGGWKLEAAKSGMGEKEGEGSGEKRGLGKEDREFDRGTDE
jgi:hypothetical protein